MSWAAHESQLLFIQLDWPSLPCNCMSVQHGLEGRGGGIFKTPPFCSLFDSRGEISTFLVTASCYSFFLPSRLDLGYKVLGVFIEKAPLCPTWCWVSARSTDCPFDPSEPSGPALKEIMGMVFASFRKLGIHFLTIVEVTIPKEHSLV